MKADNFIAAIEELKKKDKLDLSLGQDLSIGIMNLISLEEHFEFSFMKTSDQRYLQMLEQTRELRKRLLKKIVKTGTGGEDWCISKHLLAATMRLTEVGTKYLHNGKKKEAEEVFTDAFNLYSLFWVVNGAMGSEGAKIKEFGVKELGAAGKVKSGKVAEGKAGFSKIAEIFKKIIDCCKE